jgi:hypothetical protein
MYTGVTCSQSKYCVAPEATLFIYLLISVTIIFVYLLNCVPNVDFIRKVYRSRKVENGCYRIQRPIFVRM